jgi:hypothetical protein
MAESTQLRNADTEGTREIRLESADRAAGYFTTRSPASRTSTRGRLVATCCANPEDLSILDGRDNRRRAELIAERLSEWKATTGG